MIACRSHLMTLLGRKTPELPEETVLGETESCALPNFRNERGPRTPDNVGWAVSAVA